MKDIWQRLGSKDAINWVALAFLIVLQLNGALLVNANVQISGREGLFLFLVVIPFIPMAGVLAIGRLWIIPRVKNSLRPFCTLVIFEIAIVLRVWLFDELLLSSQLITHSQFWSRLGPAQANQMITFIVVAYLVSSARDFNTQNRELATSLQNLEADHRDVRERLSSRQQRLISSIQRQLKDALEVINGSNLRKDVNRLQTLIDDVVRPLSHRLGRQIVTQQSEPIEVSTSRVQWVVLLRNTMNSNPLHPLLFASWMSLAAVMTYLPSFGPQIIVTALIFGAVSIAVLYIARLLWQLLPEQTWLLVRVFLFTAVPAALALAMVRAMALFTNINLIYRQFAFAIYFEVIAWTIALVFTSREMLRETNTNLAAATLSLRRQVAGENATARNFEDGVSRVLHGPIQDAIASSLRKLQTLPIDSNLTTNDVAKIRQPIEHALQLLEHPESGRQSVLESLESLQRLWSGVVDIELTLDSEVLTRLSSAEATSSAVVELLREAISNSIRHGDATQIKINLWLIEEDVFLKVANNGKPISSSDSIGIGTKLLNDLTLSWSRKNEAGHVILEAIVPLTTQYGEHPNWNEKISGQTPIN